MVRGHFVFLTFCRRVMHVVDLVMLGEDNPVAEDDIYPDEIEKRRDVVFHAVIF